MSHSRKSVSVNWYFSDLRTIKASPLHPFWNSLSFFPVKTSCVSISRSNALNSVYVSPVMLWPLTTCWISYMLNLLLIPPTFRRRALSVHLKFKSNFDSFDCYSSNTLSILVASHPSFVPNSLKVLIAPFSYPRLNIS